MKPSAKRRRSKAQIKEERKQEEKRKAEIQAKLLAWDDIEAELERKTEENKLLKRVQSQVQGMWEEGQIKEVRSGVFEAVIDPVEREQIQSKRKSDIQKEQMAAQASHQESMSQMRQSEVDEILDVDLNLE